MNTSRQYSDRCRTWIWTRKSLLRTVRTPCAATSGALGRSQTATSPDYLRFGYKMNASVDQPRLLHGTGRRYTRFSPITQSSVCDSLNIYGQADGGAPVGSTARCTSGQPHCLDGVSTIALRKTVAAALGFVAATKRSTTRSGSTTLRSHSLALSLADRLDGIQGCERSVEAAES
jgi:hypothetical protein